MRPSEEILMREGRQVVLVLKEGEGKYWNLDILEKMDIYKKTSEEKEKKGDSNVYDSAALVELDPSHEQKQQKPNLP